MARFGVIPRRLEASVVKAVVLKGVGGFRELRLARAGALDDRLLGTKDEADITRELRQVGRAGQPKPLAY